MKRILIGLGLAAGGSPALAEVICGHEIKTTLVIERPSKFHASDRKGKTALGTLVAACEVDGVRYLVSSPDGKPDNPLLSGFIYRKAP